MKKFISIILTFAFILNLGTIIYAENNSQKFIIGYTELPPFNFHENGMLKGYDTELAQYVCNKLGLEPEFVEIDWDTKETELDCGSIDCIWNALSCTEERKQSMNLSDIYLKCYDDYDMNVSEYCVALKKGNTLVEQINSALSEAKTDGTIMLLTQKYDINNICEDTQDFGFDDKIKVKLNGEEIEFDTEPVIIQDRTFVPIRSVCEKLGADVYWIEKEKSVVIVKNNTKIILQIDMPYIMTINCSNYDEFENILMDDELYANRVSEKLVDVSPVIQNDRTLLPIRYVCEELGASVEWDSNSKTVIITYDKEITENTDKEFFGYFELMSNSYEEQTTEIKGEITFMDCDGNVIIDKQDILNAEVKCNENEYYIELTFTADGQNKFANATENISKRPDGENYIAICVNGDIVSAPIVADKIDCNTCIIMGDFTKESAEALADLIIFGY